MTKLQKTEKHCDEQQSEDVSCSINQDQLMKYVTLHMTQTFSRLQKTGNGMVSS